MASFSFQYSDYSATKTISNPDFKISFAVEPWQAPHYSQDGQRYTTDYGEVFQKVRIHFPITKDNLTEYEAIIEFFGNSLVNWTQNWFLFKINGCDSLEEFDYVPFASEYMGFDGESAGWTNNLVVGDTIISTSGSKGALQYTCTFVDQSNDFIRMNCKNYSIKFENNDTMQVYGEVSETALCTMDSSWFPVYLEKPLVPINRQAFGRLDFTLDLVVVIPGKE